MSIHIHFSLRAALQQSTASLETATSATGESKRSGVLQHRVSLHSGTVLTLEQKVFPQTSTDVQSRHFPKMKTLTSHKLQPHLLTGCNDFLFKQQDNIRV